jgi:FkbM family methyltransferase
VTNLGKQANGHVADNQPWDVHPMDLQLLNCVGLTDFARAVSSIVRGDGFPLSGRGVRATLAAARHELDTLDRKVSDGSISREVFVRRRYTILCWFKVLLDEIGISNEALSSVEAYLAEPHFAIPGVLIDTLPNACTLQCRMTDYVEFMTRLYGVYEPRESYVFQSVIDAGMVVVDSGANTGQDSLLAGTKVGQAGSVHSFEPYSESFRTLRNNILNNNLTTRCSINNTALWSSNGRVTLQRPTSSPQTRSYETNNGAYRIGEADSENDAPSIMVQAMTLDSYASKCSLKRIDVIRLNVEGAELDVLDGAVESACHHRHVAAGFRLLSTGVGAHRGKLVYVPSGWSQIGVRRKLVVPPLWFGKKAFKT